MIVENQNKKDAEWIFEEYLKSLDTKDYPSARRVAYNILLDTDAKRNPRWVKFIMKEHQDIDLKLS